jgi:hypothetical protein
VEGAGLGSALGEAFFHGAESSLGESLAQRWTMGRKPLKFINKLEQGPERSLGRARRHGVGFGGEGAGDCFPSFA